MGTLITGIMTLLMLLGIFLCIAWLVSLAPVLGYGLMGFFAILVVTTIISFGSRK